MRQRTVEHVADVSQLREETLEVEWLVPREHAQQRINEHIVEVPLPQNAEDVKLRAARIMREVVESRRAFELSMSEMHFSKMFSSSVRHVDVSTSVRVVRFSVLPCTTGSHTQHLKRCRVKTERGIPDTERTGTTR